MPIYRSVFGVNKEVKKQFRGLGGINREIKEQYRSVGGTNRKVFSALPTWEKYNAITTVTYGTPVYSYSGTPTTLASGTAQSFGNPSVVSSTGSINVGVEKTLTLGVALVSSYNVMGKCFIRSSRAYIVTSYTTTGTGTQTKYSTVTGHPARATEYVSTSKGTYIEDVSAPEGTYPADGYHTDGFWYVLK